MTMNDQELKTATIWIDGAVTLLVKHRRSHDALNLTPCVCTICVSARFLIEHVPMLKPLVLDDMGCTCYSSGMDNDCPKHGNRPDPRTTGFRDSRGGLPK